MKIFFIYAFFNYKHTKGKHTRAFHQIVRIWHDAQKTKRFSLQKQIENVFHKWYYENEAGQDAPRRYRYAVRAVPNISKTGGPL